MHDSFRVGPLELPESKLGKQFETRIARGDFDLLQGMALIDAVSVGAEMRGALHRALHVWSAAPTDEDVALQSLYEPVVWKRREPTTVVLFRMATAHEPAMNERIRPGLSSRESLLGGAIRGYLDERRNAPDFEQQVHSALASLRGQFPHQFGGETV